MADCRPPVILAEEGSVKPLGGTHLLSAGYYCRIRLGGVSYFFD